MAAITSLSSATARSYSSSKAPVAPFLYVFVMDWESIFQAGSNVTWIRGGSKNSHLLWHKPNHAVNICPVRSSSECKRVSINICQVHNFKYGWKPWLEVVFFDACCHLYYVTLKLHLRSTCLSPLKDWTKTLKQFSSLNSGKYGKNKTSIYA